MLIEQIVIEHLKTILGTDDIYAELPEAVPESFVLLTITDRRQQNFIDSVTMELHSYAKSKAEVSALDKSVRKAMETLVIHDEISSSKIGGGDDEPDVWLEKYRYRSIYNIVFYDD